MNKQFLKELPFILAFLFLVAFVGWDYRNLERSNLTIRALETTTTSFLVLDPPQNASGEATSTEKTQVEEIEDYIREKFGKDANKAFLLLKGKGEGTCAENRTLDQNLVNDNTVWGGVGRDWGIFQINDVYHPVFELNLHQDWKANVDYAYRIFVNDGRSFKRWTCGRWFDL